MFPLGNVLLPHMPLALRLFEPRYLIMLGRLLEVDRPEFGVVLIERGHEVGGGDHRFGVGTMARIIAVESHSDHMSLLAVGTRRFHVRQWLADDPYPRADVDPLPEMAGDDSLADSVAEVAAMVRGALVDPDGGTSWPPELELSEDPAVACWQVAGLAPLGPLDQLSLLRSASPAELLERTAVLLAEAVELASRLGEGPAGQ
jgi:hypothetical protein